MDITQSLKCLPEKHLNHWRIICAFQFTVVMHNIMKAGKNPENSQDKEKFCEQYLNQKKKFEDDPSKIQYQLLYFVLSKGRVRGFTISICIESEKLFYNSIDLYP